MRNPQLSLQPLGLLQAMCIRSDRKRLTWSIRTVMVSLTRTTSSRWWRHWGRIQPTSYWMLWSKKLLVLSTSQCSSLCSVTSSVEPTQKTWSWTRLRASTKNTQVWSFTWFVAPASQLSFISFTWTLIISFCIAVSIKAALLSCFLYCLVRVGGVNWIGDKTRQFPISVLSCLDPVSNLQLLSQPEDYSKLSWLAVNSVHTADMDKTRQWQFRLVRVGGVK